MDLLVLYNMIDIDNIGTNLVEINSINHINSVSVDGMWASTAPRTTMNTTLGASIDSMSKRMRGPGAKRDPGLVSVFFSLCRTSFVS